MVYQSLKGSRYSSLTFLVVSRILVNINLREVLNTSYLNGSDFSICHYSPGFVFKAYFYDATRSTGTITLF